MYYTWGDNGNEGTEQRCQMGNVKLTYQRLKIIVF